MNKPLLHRKLLSGSIRAALLSGLIAVPLVHAQDDDTAELDRLQVTGSRISRVDVETAVPVQTFDAEFIANTGAPTLQDFLFQSNIAGPALFNENSTLSQTAGTANFDARGFGDDYVIILLNGRRLPGDPLSGDNATNINLIPLAAIDRIEYLSDGASAIYGADAISGVINIITKQQFEGINVDVRVGQTAEGDGDTSQIAFSIGNAGPKGSAVLSFSYTEQDDIDAATRPLIRSASAPDGTDGRSPTGLPGTFLIFRPDGSSESFPGPGCPSENIRPASFTAAGTECAFDFAPLYDAIPAQRTYSFIGTGDYRLTDDITTYGEFRYSRNFTEVRNGAAPGTFNITGAPFLADLDSQIGSDLSAGGVAYAVRRSVDAGPRATDNTNTAFSVVAGLNWAFADFHELDVWVQSVDSEQNRIGVGGNVSISAFSQAVVNGQFDLAQTYNPQFYQDLGLTVNTQRQATGDEDSLTAEMTGFFDVGFGDSDLGYAVGFRTKDDAFRDLADVASSSGDVAGGASSNGGGERSNDSLYGELAFSPFDTLELSAAVRYDDYTWTNNVNTGGDDATTYRVAAAFRPIDQLLIRGSYGTGFKAPTLGELFLGRSFGVTQAVDTTTCNTVSANPGSTQAEIDAACRLQEIRSVSGGNPFLETEDSDQYSFGVVWSPTADLSFSADYYNIEVDNKIGSLTVQEIINNESIFPDLITRVGGSLTNPQAEVRSNLQNLTQENGEGIDLSAQYRFETDIGQFGFDVRSAYLLSHERQLSALQPLCDDKGTTSEPEWRTNFQGVWSRSNWEAALTARYVGETEDLVGGRNTLAATCDPNPTGQVRPVDDYLELGASVGYTFDFGTKVVFGVRNLTDEEPPFSELAAGGWPWFDQALYDIRLRNYYLNITHEF